MESKKKSQERRSLIEKEINLSLPKPKHNKKVLRSKGLHDHINVLETIDSFLQTLTPELIQPVNEEKLRRMIPREYYDTSSSYSNSYEEGEIFARDKISKNLDDNKTNNDNYNNYGITIKRLKSNIRKKKNVSWTQFGQDDTKMIQPGSNDSEKMFNKAVEKRLDEYLTKDTLQSASNGIIFLLGFLSNSNTILTYLPKDIITYILQLYCQFLVPTIVFGFHRGYAVSSAQTVVVQDASPLLYPAYSVLGSTHWNAEVTSKSTLYVALYKTSVVRRIVLSNRCFKLIEIIAHKIGSPGRILLPTIKSRMSDDDTTGIGRVIEFTFPQEQNMTDYLEIILQKGGNVSLHWLLVYGLVSDWI